MSSDGLIINPSDFNNKKPVNRVAKNERIVIDHFKAAIVLTRCIQLCPCDEWIKKVMLRRVGRPWEGKMPMTHMAIALELGCLEKEVKEIEEVGKKIVGDYMAKSMDMASSKKFETEIANQAVVQENTESTTVNPDNLAA